MAGRLQDFDSLAKERTRLYNKAAKMKRGVFKQYIAEWRELSYDQHLEGKITERDPTCLFDIYRKYIPERSRLREHLFTEASIHSDIGRQCLQDMVNICTSTERVAYYPGELPVNGRCPVCNKEMTRFV